MLLLVAIVTWKLKDFGPLNQFERAVPFRVWIFQTKSLDKKLDEWLGS